MIRNIKKYAIAIVMMTCATASFATSLHDLGVAVATSENREYSYTDKKAGFWYGHTHADSPMEFYSGWNIAKKRIFSDYTLFVDGKQLKRAGATECTVYPEKISRTWKNAEENLFMVDKAEILFIQLNAKKGKTIGIKLNTSLLKQISNNTFAPIEAPNTIVKIAAANKGNALTFKNNIISSSTNAGGFIIVHGTEAKCDSLIAAWHSQGNEMLSKRAQRMSDLINNNCPLSTNLPQLDKSIKWITLTMDQLITEQQGKGIYAGLPWFNEYWGRDMFIAIPGATLVTGQFEYTADILRDFAKFQDRDTTSITCGRIPNRANLEGILYNTADGTPRYVIEAEELLRYWGNRSFLEDIYPTIVLSIDQTIEKCIDEKGYLIHDDADTWMDVKRNGIPGSPRGNRANDIQYLWHEELCAGARMAMMLNDTTHATKWTAIASRLAKNFEEDYCDKKNILIYDHLNSDGSADTQFRPNQLFCFDLISDDAFKQKVTARVWKELTYPWGVASLSQTDPQFHPQHENWHYYHKDDAYHNGTIWLWNNGIAMQRMIEYGQIEMAWKLFQNMNRQALVEGAVGSLSENADAHPREGKNWVNRSGTFLQAWSNSEQLRIWHQYILGIQPDLMNGVINIAPHLPKELTEIHTSVMIGNGKLLYDYKDGKFNIRTENIGNVKISFEAVNKKIDSTIFKGIDFCKPNPLPSYPCFSEYHDPPLTY